MSANYFSVDVGGTSIKWGLVSPEMVLLEQGSVPNEENTAEGLVAAIASLVAAHAGVVQGVGVSVPGTVDEADPQGVVLGGGRLA